MFRLLKFVLLFSSFCSFADFNPLEGTYCCCRDTHRAQRTAWGGNGGDWGSLNSNWFGEYGWPERGKCDYACYVNRCNPCNVRRCYRPRPIYKYVDDNVDGAGLYLNFCPRCYR